MIYENRPILSICIPTYNRCEHIKRQIETFAKEKLVDVEVIVSCNPVDENDLTVSYLKELKFEWLKININKINVGPTKNFDICLNMAAGEYIWCLGDDDYFKKNMLQVIIPILKAKQPTVYHMNYYNYDSKNKKIIPNPLVKIKSFIQYSKKDYIKQFGYDFSSALFMSSNIFRNDIAKLKVEQKYAELCWAYRLYIAMNKGDCIFDDSVLVLSNTNISWTERFNKITFDLIPSLLESLDLKRSMKIYLGIRLVQYLKHNKFKFPQEFKYNKACYLKYMFLGFWSIIKFKIFPKRKINLNEYNI